ncbi:MAG: redox-sensing transcriptional repressor Rex [Christensenella sp.]|uniref:redox-sensing transcriptional repressor Rex n=1 Tax=Christensenella sp. TaxID=1935934 RepID=UPI002B21E143|nr:redox-sensing transcriptional repressor Rex [Christensenella sp.]MEA5004607.1 redox-sensing transcriptional repressor Rex [Christensenella sp.]
MSEKISPAVIRRLPRYYRYLEDLEGKGIDKISSSQMSIEMSLNASQIRRDLNCFGGFGQQGYGYSVGKLKKEIARILGLDKRYNVIIVGAGRIGQALLGYKNFMLEGFNIVDIFDSDPTKVGALIEGRMVQDIAKMETYLKGKDIDVAIICTPKEYAQQSADLLVSFGIKAIWNFAPTDVAVRRGVAVENVHLSDSLYVLSYKLKESI